MTTAPVKPSWRVRLLGTSAPAAVVLIPLIVTMLGAEIFTKVPVLVSEGVWMYLHEARNELSQLFGLVFVLIVGAGTWSLDKWLATPPHPDVRADTTRT
ncbi:hypothetical protein [Bounagaea algeriensis]